MFLSFLSFRLLFVIGLPCSFVLAGCPFFHNASGTLEAKAFGQTAERDHTFEVKSNGTVLSRLNGRFYAASDWQNLPVVLFVPGSGNPSHLGTQKGNGIETYTEPVDVVASWAATLAEEGFSSFTYDKRTCQPAHDPACHASPLGDIYEEGPRALSKDVDAACTYLQTQLVIPNENIILWTHGQGGQVVLSSECGRNAKLNIIVSPLTDRVDRLLVRSLHHRASLLRQEASQAPEARVASLTARANTLTNRAASFEATFLSIDSDRFIEGAKFLGVPLSFWFGWRELTEEIDLQLAKHPGRVILFKGDKDLSYDNEDVRNLRSFGKQNNVELVFVPDGDHHLVNQNSIAPAARETVVRTIKNAWSGLGSSL